MTRACLLLVVVAGCARAKPPAQPELPAPAEEKWEQSCGGVIPSPEEEARREFGYGHDELTWTRCDAKGLVRIESGYWSTGDVHLFSERARVGTVAVTVSTAGVAIRPGCELPGHYARMRGNPGNDRFFATDRPLLGVEEVNDSCAGATHLVAAFVKGEDNFSAILMQLPCPSVSDPSPARWCIAQGLTGPERLARAESWIARSPELTVDLGMSIYALLPDHLQGLRYLNLLRVDCVLFAHARWIFDGFRYTGTRSQPSIAPIRRASTPPFFDENRGQSLVDGCDNRPLFISCFPEVFQTGLEYGPGFMRILDSPL